MNGSRSTGRRWKLIGNAVCVPASTWLAERLVSPGTYEPAALREHTTGRTPKLNYSPVFLAAVDNYVNSFPAAG
jgi:hypothetical protein